MKKIFVFLFLSLFCQKINSSDIFSSCFKLRDEVIKEQIIDQIDDLRYPEVRYKEVITKVMNEYIEEVKTQLTKEEFNYVESGLKTWDKKIFDRDVKPSLVRMKIKRMQGYKSWSLSKLKAELNHFKSDEGRKEVDVYFDWWFSAMKTIIQEEGSKAYFKLINKN